MGLIDDINNDFKEAMKAKDAQRVSTLRMLKSAMQYKKVELGNDLSDEEITKVIQTQVKKNRDAMEQFKKGGRDELAAKEEAESKILMKYLPEQIPEEELAKLVDEAITETGAAGPKDMGNVMKALMPKVAGRADGKTLSNLVKNKLIS